MKKSLSSYAGLRAATLFACLGAMPVAHGAGSVPEPETVFYGKVINRAGPQGQLVTEGALTWSIVGNDPASEPLQFQTELQPLADGRYSYRIDVPHSALSLGLDAREATVPLRIDTDERRHLQIEIDGVQARIVAPGGYEFDVAQALRAATYRLDLEISSPSPDSDADGMPDWWEEANGLDPQRDDADEDADGDGASNLAEWLAGSSANRDDRQPQIVTESFVAYTGATTGVPLRVRDVDSEPEQIEVTFLSLPSGGRLLLRNANEDPDAPDQDIVAGQVISLAAIDKGRLVFVNESPAASEPPERSSFMVTARDENPAHPAAEGEIEVAFYSSGLEPAESSALAALAVDPDLLDGVPTEEESRIRAAVLGGELQFVVWDLGGQEGQPAAGSPTAGLDMEEYSQQYQPDFGDERQVVVIGSPVADRLAGGVGSDIFIPGGGDDTVAGGEGADCVIYESSQDGDDTIVGFSPAQGDCIDFSRVLSGSAPTLDRYLQIASLDGDAIIGVDADGDGSGFTDFEITLEERDYTQGDLFELWVGGALRTGPIGFPSRISVATVADPASENGPVPGVFEISRSGSIDHPLEVEIALSGSASNGIDYAQVPSVITIPAGQLAATVYVTPFSDSVFEGDEVVQLTVVPAGHYELGDQNAAFLSIADRMPELSLETLDPRAVVDDSKPAVLLLRREGVLDQSLLVRLDIVGTARNGTDFERVSPFANLSPGEATRLIEIKPQPGAQIESPAETVTISLVEDPAYLLGESSEATAYLIAEEQNLAEWREQHFPEDTAGLAEFMGADPGGYGVPNLLRFGFGLDPFRPESPSGPTVELVDGRALVSFDRNLAATGVDYLLEVSSGARDWQPAGAELESVASPQFPWRSSYLAPVSRGLFFRVQVQPSP